MHPLYEKAAALTDEVIKAAVIVQKHFGIGVLESIYVRCLERELQLAGHKTSREKCVCIKYRDLTLDENLRYDLLVDDCLLIEAKACERENFGNEGFPRRGLKRVILSSCLRPDTKPRQEHLRRPAYSRGRRRSALAAILRMMKSSAF